MKSQTITRSADDEDLSIASCVDHSVAMRSRLFDFVVEGYEFTLTQSQFAALFRLMDQVVHDHRDVASRRDPLDA